MTEPAAPDSISLEPGGAAIADLHLDPASAADCAVLVGWLEEHRIGQALARHEGHVPGDRRGHQGDVEERLVVRHQERPTGSRQVLEPFHPHPMTSAEVDPAERPDEAVDEGLPGQDRGPAGLLPARGAAHRSRSTPRTSSRRSATT